MIRVQYFPEGTIDIPGKIDHTSLACFAQEDAHVVSRTRPHETLFHRQVRIGRNDSQWRRETLAHGSYMDPVHAVDDPVCIFKARQHGMVLAGRGILFQREVRVEHWTVFTAGKGSSKKRGEPEILSSHAPFVVQRSLISSYDAAATFDKGTDLVTLCCGKSCDIGQDQGAKLIRVLSIEQLVVHHLKRNSGFDQCLIKAERRIVDGSSRIGSAVERSSLLGINHANSSEGLFVAKVILVRIVPLEDLFHDREPALVVRLRVELCEGRTKILRHAIGHPEPDLVAALNGILPAVLIFKADAEDPCDRFSSHGGTELLGAFAAGPGRDNSRSA